jgi:biotin synthase
MISRETVAQLFTLPLKELLRQASTTHDANFPENAVQLSALLSIKTGGCPENCAYCPQSAHYKTNLQRHGLLSRTEIVAAAREAQQSGATRFCLGAAWREIKDGPDFDQVLESVREVKQLGLEVCCTLGMLTSGQAQRLKKAGLTAYNHNLDSSRSFYEKIISTRTYDDRLRTIESVRAAGLTVCTGGILGMGETADDRIDFLLELSSLQPHPESVTINSLIAIEGTPLEKRVPVSALEIARVIATARCLMQNSMIRLSAGRKQMTPEGQFLCFLAGANSIFIGDKLLTSANAVLSEDHTLLSQTGLFASQAAPRALNEL